MRNITVSVDDETHRFARIRAAELDTSVSALVRDFLKSLTPAQAGMSEAEVSADEAERDRRNRLLEEVIRDITVHGGGLRMADNLPRDALYDRDALR